MKFERTAASLFQPVRELSIQREHAIAKLLHRYETELESASCPDRTLLYRAQRLLEERLGQRPLDRELVELGHITYRSLGAWHQESALLRQYLSTQQLSQDEQAWARWQIVDCLALAGDDQEAVEEQKALYGWVIETFPLEECFFVLADGTQSRSWLNSAQGEHWLCLLDHLFHEAQKTAKNRLDRFYCLRSAVHLCVSLADPQKAQRYLSDLDMLLEEEAEWTERRWVTVEISILKMVLAGKCEEIAQVRTLAHKALENVQQWEQHLNSNERSEVARFRSLCHNVAAPLYRAKQYDLAIPLLQKAVSYQTNPHYSYLWLAASLWQTTHQRELVFPYLQQAAARYDGEGNPWEIFQQLPEFQDVRCNLDFLAVITPS